MSTFESIIKTSGGAHHPLEWVLRLLMALIVLALVPPQVSAQLAPILDGPEWQSDPTYNSFGLALGDIDRDGDLDVVFASTEFGSSGFAALYLNNQGAFTINPVWSSGSAAGVMTSIALGDIDRDGDLDLVCGVLGRNVMFRNDGGAFTDEPVWTADSANSTTSVALGDVDEDGDLDLACGNRDQQSNTLYENVGGVFSLAAVWNSARTYSTQGIALGDVDGNGVLDLVCANGGDGVGEPNTVYLGFGGGLSLAPNWESVPISEETQGVALGDVDGNGYLDVIFGNWGSENALYLNQGGVLSSTRSWLSQPTNFTTRVVLGDLDADGDLDLLCANEMSSNAFYRNDGGTFSAAPVELFEPRETPDLVVGDIDEDGDLDVICANAAIHIIADPPVHYDALYKNVGNVLFSSSPTWSSTPTNNTNSLVLGDVDGDRDLDLVCGNQGANMTYMNEGGELRATPGWISDVVNDTKNVSLGDVDRDGNLDLVCADYDSATLFLNPAGAFSATPDWTARSVPEAKIWSVALGDLNGDSYSDLVCGTESFAGAPNLIFANEGGLFANTAIEIEDFNQSSSLALGDVNEDGAVDLICGNIGRNSVFLNVDGTFGDQPSWESGVLDDTRAVGLADINRDGRPDLVFGGRVAVTTYLNRGGEFAVSADWTSEPVSSRGAATGDVDGDGDLDVVSGNDPGVNTAYLNEDGLLSAAPAWSSGPSNSTQGVALGDLDEDGDLDLVCANRGQSNTVYSGLRNPAYRGDPLSPTNQLPNNPAYLRAVRLGEISPNTYEVGLKAVDVESDPVWLLAEFIYKGDPYWNPVDVPGQSGLLGPWTSSPAGEAHTFQWDIARLPFDPREVILRLRVLSMPARVGLTRRITSYSKEAGVITPQRPEIGSSTDRVTFPTVTLGDTVTTRFALLNSGNTDLVITGVVLPSPEMRITRTLPIELAPHQEDTVTVFLEPITVTNVTGAITIESNDPITATKAIEVETDIRALIVDTQALTDGPLAPLGDALTILVVPGEAVRIERGAIYHRAAGANEFSSVPLVPAAGVYSGVIPGEAVTEAGLEYYVVVENSGALAAHPADAPDSVFFQPVTPPASVMTRALPNRGDDFVPSDDFKVEITVPTGATFVSGVLHVRGGGETVYDEFPVVAGDPPTAVVGSELIGERGVEYWVEVRTLSSTLTDPPLGPASAPRTVRVTTSLAESREHPGGLYRLLSVPLDMGTTPILGIITDDLGGPDKTRWRLWGYYGLPDPAESTTPYLELPGEGAFGAFDPGRGYWLLTRDSHRIDIAPAEGLTMPTDRPFTVGLPPGFRMIGNPFAFPVAWDSVQVDGLTMSEAEGIAVEPLWRWDPSDATYKQDVTVLEPFEGYWIKNITSPETQVVISIPAREAPGGATQVADGQIDRPFSRADRDRWVMSVFARSGTVSDLSNRIGRLDGARALHDRYDRSEPPMGPGGWISLYFPHVGWNHHAGYYAVDMRGDESLPDLPRRQMGEAEPDLWGHLWRFDVAKSFSNGRGGDEVTLTFSGVGGAPEDAEIRLVDRQLERLVDLREENHYEFYQGRRAFVTSDEDARFVLIVGSEEFVERQGRPLVGLPTETLLHQNVPNPFNPSTIVRYELVGRGHVSLRVYDVSGALVRILEDRERGPGRYEVGWDGENERGDRVASGIYFYRLTAPGFSQTMKMVLLK